MTGNWQISTAPQAALHPWRTRPSPPNHAVCHLPPMFALQPVKAVFAVVRRLGAGLPARRSTRQRPLYRRYPLVALATNCNTSVAPTRTAALLIRKMAHALPCRCIAIDTDSQNCAPIAKKMKKMKIVGIPVLD